MTVSKHFICGDTVGRLTLVRSFMSNKDASGNRHRLWACRCECGSFIKVKQSSLVKDNPTKSCGCLTKEVASIRSTTHGMSGHYLFHTWNGAMRRCYNPKEKKYANYGGRGIQVCDRWHVFENFLEDMGDRPSKDYSLDRHPDNDGNYEPGNCRWATLIEQGRNKRNNRIVNVGGVDMCFAEAVEMHGLDYDLAYGRLQIGWSLNRILRASQ